MWGFRKIVLFKIYIFEGCVLKKTKVSTIKVVRLKLAIYKLWRSMGWKTRLIVWLIEIWNNNWKRKQIVKLLHKLEWKSWKWKGVCKGLWNPISKFDFGKVIFRMKERLIVYKPFQPPNMVRQEVLIGGLQRRLNYKR